MNLVHGEYGAATRMATAQLGTVGGSNGAVTLTVYSHFFAHIYKSPHRTYKKHEKREQTKRQFQAKIRERQTACVGKKNTRRKNCNLILNSNLLRVKGIRL